MKAERLINSGIPILCGILLTLMVLIIFLQIVLRQFFNFSLNWSDEVSQFCMTWLVLFGSIWATQNDQHLNTGIKLHKKLNERQVYLIDGILSLIIAGVAAVVAYQSALFSLATMDNASLSLDWIKMGYIFLVLPLSMLVMCCYHLKDFFKNLARVFKRD
jgi:TRAP-type C4-dicarboxylate transport system permease small subunit